MARELTKIKEERTRRERAEVGAEEARAERNWRDVSLRGMAMLPEIAQRTE
jgi:hypothetical protein